MHICPLELMALAMAVPGAAWLWAKVRSWI